MHFDYPPLPLFPPVQKTLNVIPYVKWLKCCLFPYFHYSRWGKPYVIYRVISCCCGKLQISRVRACTHQISRQNQAGACKHAPYEGFPQQELIIPANSIWSHRTGRHVGRGGAFRTSFARREATMNAAWSDVLAAAVPGSPGTLLPAPSLLD